MGVMKSRLCSWPQPGARGANHKGLFRIKKKTGDTMGLKCTMDFLGKAETTIGPSRPGLFVNTLETVTGVKKLIVPVFVRVHGQDEEVWSPLFPSSNFSMILSTVRREHST
jgi:hypothetical protein